MTKYHIIEPSGVVTTTEWTAELGPHGCIPYKQVLELMTVEVVAPTFVIWKGQQRIMIIDELAKMRANADPNAKATRIAMNAMFRREGLHQFVYDDLDRSPMFKMFSDGPELSKSLKARALVRSFRDMVYGRVLLWEGAIRFGDAD